MTSADQSNATADRVFIKPLVSRHAVTLVPITGFPDFFGGGIIIPVIPGFSAVS